MIPYTSTNLSVKGMLHTRTPKHHPFVTRYAPVPNRLPLNIISMTFIISYITVGLCGFYVLLTGLLCLGLFRLAKRTDLSSPLISIIIPAKNEENNILSCLNALAQQTYPHSKIEIILVNDRSTDQTVVQAQLSPLSNLKIITVEQQTHICPKKNAIHQGILASAGEIILTTDADCHPEPDWVNTTIQCFTPSVGMVLGYAPLLTTATHATPLLSLQSLVVAALSAGSAGIGFPMTCTGRNLAYRRKTYDAVNGFEGIGHIIGGDDVYLMNKIAQTPYKIVFNLAPKSSVLSHVHTDNQFNRQLRYQSKSLHYGLSLLLPALAVYIFHLIFFLVPVWAIYTPAALNAVVYCFIAKVFVDALFLGIAAKRFGCFRQMIWFPFLEMVLLPYIVIVCALGALMPTKWK